MGFVKRPDEIARIEHALSHPRFVNGEMLSVDFLTDPAVVEEILPPPLEPADTPRVTAMVGRWQSNCVGDFYGGAIYVAARHDGVDGDYVLAMYMDNDIPTIYGRDLFGEPKKLATSQVHRHGDTFHGYVDRHGVRLIELHGLLTTDLGPFEAVGVNYNFKARPNADGHGLQEDAILTKATFDTRATAAREGAGSVVLRGAFLECDLIAACEAVATTPADVYLPYHHGRHDDWSALDTESAAVVPVA
jgi:acetoacetate decarboxylase